MDKKSKNLTVMIVSIVLFVVCLFITIYLNRKVAGQEIDKSEIKEVTCVVTEVKKTSVKANGSKTDFYTVQALYDGKEQQIHNASAHDRFSEGSSAKVLLYRGKLYANMAGIESTTSLAYVYFGFLFGSVAMLVFMVKAISKYNREKWDS